MAVVIETTLGDITVDLFLQQRPVTCLNFLKLCKMKYYNFNLFHTIRSGFIAQTGDPTGEGSGGQSIFGLLEGPEKRFFSGEKMPKIRHTNTGLLSMVGTGDMMIGSQFFFTLGPDLDSLDGTHCVIGEVTEGHDVLRKLNEVICDESHRPYQDVRITHTVVLEDPYSDPTGFRALSRSPSPSAERLRGGRIAPDEELDETQGKSAQEIQEMIEEKEAKARATILEIVGDLPDADIAPPENVLFVCKLNPVTTDEDLEIIFSRFGKIVSCEVIRDKKTGDSLQYAFIEFADKKSCEDAYFKMDNVLIDDRRIHVDFSQSVSKIKWLGKGRGVKHLTDDEVNQNNFNDKNKSRRPRSEDRDRNHVDRNMRDKERYHEVRGTQKDTKNRGRKDEDYDKDKNRDREISDRRKNDRERHRNEKDENGKDIRNSEKNRDNREKKRDDRERYKNDRDRHRDEKLDRNSGILRERIIDEKVGERRRESNRKENNDTNKEMSGNKKETDKKESRKDKEYNESKSDERESKLDNRSSEKRRESNRKEHSDIKEKATKDRNTNKEGRESKDYDKGSVKCRNQEYNDQLETRKMEKRERSMLKRRNSRDLISKEKLNYHKYSDSDLEDKSNSYKSNKKDSNFSDSKSESRKNKDDFEKVKRHESEKNENRLKRKSDCNKSSKEEHHDLKRKRKEETKEMSDKKKSKHVTQTQNLRTPSPDQVKKHDKVAKKKPNRKLKTDKKVKADKSKKKHKKSTSSEDSESSSTSSSSSDSSSSSESVRNKKSVRRKKKRKVSTSSSSSSSSESSSSSSSDSSSESSSSSSSESDCKKKKTKSSKKKITKKSKRR